MSSICGQNLADWAKHGLKITAGVIAVTIGVGERTEGKLEPETYNGFRVEGSLEGPCAPPTTLTLITALPLLLYQTLVGERGKRKKPRMLRRRMDGKAGEIFQSIFNCLDVGWEERQHMGGVGMESSLRG